MKGFFAISIIAILITACNPLERSVISPEEAIPENAALILKVNDPIALKRELKNSAFLPSAAKDKGLLLPVEMLSDLEIDYPGYLLTIPSPSDSLSYFVHWQSSG